MAAGDGQSDPLLYRPQAQIDTAMENLNLMEQDKLYYIEEIYETRHYTLSKFVVDLEKYTNILANKKSQ